MDALTADELRICKLLGISPETMQAGKETGSAEPDLSEAEVCRRLGLSAETMQLGKQAGVARLLGNVTGDADALVNAAALLSPAELEVCRRFGFSVETMLLGKRA